LLAHDEKALSHGWVAECGRIASNDGRFASGVKAAAERGGGARQLMAKLQSQPDYVFQISGWQDASQDVSAAVADDRAPMQALSFRLDEIAYGRTGREAELAAKAKASGVTGATTASHYSVGAMTPMMTQILALGAVMAASQQSHINAETVESSLVVDKDNDECLRWSDLNLKQCLAAARDNQERAYCLSVEAISSRSDCWSKVVASGS
jgi:hypothetical protein